MKSDLLDLKADVRAIKEDVALLKKEVKELKHDVVKLHNGSKVRHESRIDDLQFEVNDSFHPQEGEINRHHQILDNHETRLVVLEENRAA